MSWFPLEDVTLETTTILYHTETMEIKGRIIMVLPLASGVSRNGNEWRKQEYILETTDQYPRKICFNLWGDKIDQFALQQGEDVTVHIDLESREFNGRWYTDVRAWRIDRGIAPDQPPVDPFLGNPEPAPQAAPIPNFSAQPTVSPMDTLKEPGGDDLPF